MYKSSRRPLTFPRPRGGDPYIDLAERGTKNMVFDPYNRGEDVNTETLDYLRNGGKAETATCANVLNVIAEREARYNVILEAAKAINPDEKAYFMVYEGDGTGIGKKTSAGWQNNRKTTTYIAEIGKYFGNITRNGKLIIAAQPKSDLPKAFWEISPGKAVRYSRDDTKNAMPQIVAGMTDEQRYEILKDKSIAAPRYDHTKLKGIDEKAVDKLSRGDARKLMRTLGEQFGIFKEYRNEDIDVRFTFSKRNLAESLNKQSTGYGNFAKMMTVFGNVAENAVGIETHAERYNSPGSDLDAMYVLMSAFRTQSGIVPVLMEVKAMKNDRGNVLYLTVSMHEIKETDIVAHASPANAINSYAPSASQKNSVPLSSEYRIADIISKVNTEDAQLLKYIPDGFLSDSQKEAKATELLRTEEYIQNKNASKYNKKSVEAASDVDGVAETGDGLPRRSEDRLAMTPAGGKVAASTDAAVVPSSEGAETQRSAGLQAHPEEWTAKRVGSADKAPMRVSGIIAKIRHDFGFNITTGHIRGKGVRGQFNLRDKGIRLFPAHAGVIPTDYEVQYAPIPAR